MRSSLLPVIVLGLWLVVPVNGQHWPQFRGPDASGIGVGNPPIEWDVTTGKNVAWKSAIRGLGHSSPVVWGKKVFLTTAVNSATETPSLETGWLGGTGKAADEEGDWTWQVICLDMDTGQELWSRDVAQGQPEIKRHLKASHANCSVATNGEQVVAFFGSEGLHCFDLDGTELWSVNFGRLHSGPYNAEELEWGFASSPVIHEDRVIVQCDCLNTAFVAVLDIADGSEVMRIERDDVATWSTPAVITSEQGKQIVCNGYKQMAGYDFESGQELWTLAGGGDVPVPTPLYANELIYITNGHGRSPTYAVSPDARGDLTPPGETEDSEDEKAAPETHESGSGLPRGLTWWQPRDGSYMPTPIVIGELLYTCNDNGRLAVRDALTGETVYRKRVGEESGTFSASAVATRERIYFCSEKGLVIIIKTGPEYELIAEIDMGEVIMATPAIAGDRLLIRTSTHLYCLESR